MHWAGITAILLYELPCPVRSGPGPGPGSRAHCTRIVDGKKIGLTTTRAQPQTRYFESLAFTWPLREKLSEKLAFLAHAFLAAGASTVTEKRVGDPIDRHLKVVLIRAPFDVCRGAGPCRRRSPLQAKLGPLESAACEVTRLPPVHEAQLESERHGIEVCNLRERDSDTIALVRTERSVCHRRSPSAVRPWRLCAEGGGIECAETAIKKACPAAGGSRQQVRPGRQRPGRARTGP